MQFSIVNYFRGLSSWLSARSSTLFMLAGVSALRHCMDDHLLAISQTTSYLPVMLIFLFRSFILSIFNYPETSCTNLWLHNHCWLANIWL